MKVYKKHWIEFSVKVKDIQIRNMIKLTELLNVELGKVYSWIITLANAKSFVKVKISMKKNNEHFGGGENIDILGYETKHFDICKSAVILYNKLKEKDLNDDGKELVISSAKELDHLFEMEKQVVRGEEVDHDPLNMVLNL